MTNKESIKQQLQEIADTSATPINFTARAAKVLKIPNLSYQSAYYWIKKLEIKTNFKQGRPEKFK